MIKAFFWLNYAKKKKKKKNRIKQFYLVPCVYRLSDPNTLPFIKHWRFCPQWQKTRKETKFKNLELVPSMPLIPYKGRYTLSVKLSDFTVCRHT